MNKFENTASGIYTFFFSILILILILISDFDFDFNFNFRFNFIFLIFFLTLIPFSVFHFNTRYAFHFFIQGKALDSLINYETVKIFSNEKHEADQFEKSLKQFQEASIKTQSSLSALNFGQNAIFSTGLVAMMLMCAHNIGMKH